jgi:lactam utilization protein B
LSYCRQDAEPPVFVEKAKDAESTVFQEKAKDAEPPVVKETAKDRQYEQEGGLAPRGG